MSPDTLSPFTWDTEFRPHLEPVLERFESAWQRGPRPALDGFRTAAGPGPADLLVELVLIDLECRWKAGETVRLEPYLARYPELAGNPGAVLRCLAQEWTLRRRREPDLRPAEYELRFPLYPDRLAMFLSRALCPTNAKDAGPGLPGLFTFPGYDVLGLLGRGGMGVVYQARQQRRGRLVALKTLTDLNRPDAELVARLRAEARACARLRHPHIVRLLESGEHDGRPFLAFDLVRGGSLQQRLVGALPLPEALALVETLARAVHYIHERGIIHCDLKPENILLAPADGSRLFPLIADFGLARRADAAVPQTYPDRPAGTPVYMAPEQTAGPGTSIGPATDIWALGVILYELVTGQNPMQDGPPREGLCQAIDQNQATLGDLASGLPQKVDCICRKCLQRDPRKRYPDGLDLAGELRQCLAGLSATGMAPFALSCSAPLKQG